MTPRKHKAAAPQPRQARTEVWRQVSTLIPDKRNARTHSPEQVAQIAASITEFGWTNPVLVDEAGRLVAGHGRVMAATLLGQDEVPTLIVAGLSEPQRRSLLIADNQLALNAGWDEDLLRTELEALGEDGGLDMEVLGFDADAIATLLGWDGGILDPELLDDAPAVQAVAVSMLGDLWTLGAHRLMCGDSTSVDAARTLMQGETADLVFTDPPYGVDYDGGHAVKGKRREKLANDATPKIYSDALPIAYAISKENAALYLWFSDSKSAAVTAAVTAAGYEVRNTLIWNKNIAQFGAIGAQYKSKHEPCLYCFKKGNAPYWAGPTNEVSVWDISREAKNEFHPTQKPVELAERALRNSCPEAGIVLDLFGGSGSTLIACEANGRSGRLMELNVLYVDVIIRRWQKLTGKAALLSDGRTFDQVAAQRAERKAPANA